MNNKGFAISGILYSVLTIFLVLIALLLFNLQNKKTILDQLKVDTIDAVESDNNYEYLLTLIGATDISSIGDGTVTGAISSLNEVQTADIEVTDNITKAATCAAIKSGNIIRYRLTFTANVSFNGSTDVLIATIPEGYRLKRSYSKDVALTGGITAVMRIETSGEIYLGAADGESNSGWWNHIDETILDY